MITTYIHSLIDTLFSSIDLFIPLQYSCLENPMNGMKRQKDRLLKDELPRSVGAQYTAGDQCRNNSRKNEELQSKQKQHLVVDVTEVNGNKVRCCKEPEMLGP